MISEIGETGSSGSPAGPDDMLERALVAAGHMAYRYDPSRDEVSHRGAVRAITGRDPGELLSLADLTGMLHPDDREKMLQFDRHPSAMGEGYRLHFRFVHPDGTVVACEAVGELVRRDGEGDGIRAGIVVPVRTTRPSLDRAMELAGLIEFLPDCASLHATDGRCISINASGRRMLGIAPRADVGRFALTDLVVDATSMPAHRLTAAVVAHGSHSTDVVMVDRATGRQLPAAWSATLLDDGGSGAHRFIVCIARDVSDALEIEWELRQNQRRLTHALEVSRLGEWSMDIRTQTGHQSSRVADIFGIADAAEQWNYRVFLAHVHPDDRERVDRLFSRSLETGRDLDFEARIVRNDGAHRWIGAKASLNTGLGGDGRTIGGVIQDITDRKFAEQRDRFLADVSVPLSTLVDDRSTLEQVARLAVPFLADHCSIDLAVESGALSRIVSTSSLLGREAVGDNPLDAQGVPPQHPTAVRRMLERGETVVLDIVDAALLDGFARTRSERLSLRALNVRSYLGVPLTLRGRHIGVLHFYRTDADTQYTPTDARVARELAARVAVALENARLVKALQDSDHRKDEFLAMLSHELRNPLESLSMGVSLIESDEAESDWARGMMRGQIARLAGILEDLLDVSRYTFNKIVLNTVPIALGPLLAEVADEARSEAELRGYRLEVSLPEAPVHAAVDPLRLSQVIANLLTNAIKYGGDSGRIRVRLEAPDAGTGSLAAIRVSDEGVGIAPKDLRDVFEMFSQVNTTIDRSRGGLGMGLTLVKRIVEMHGGTVEAVSAGAGHGTEFSLWLPVTDEAPRQAPVADVRAAVRSGHAARLPLQGAGGAGTAETRATRGASAAGRAPSSLEAPPSEPKGVARSGAASAGASVPVPGDPVHEPANDASRLMLVDDNLETVAALQKLFVMKGYEVRTAHDGIAAVELAEAFRPRMAVLDIGLPGASGYEVAASLRTLYADEPLLLIALSGYGQQKDRDRSKEAGFDHHLLKPVNFRAVLELLETGAPADRAAPTG